MKKFEWRMIRGHDSMYFRPCILQIEESGNALFWGALVEMGELYHPIVLDKDRKRYLHIVDDLSLKEGKQAIEKELFDIEVIEDGDILVDYTE